MSLQSTTKPASERRVRAGVYLGEHAQGVLAYSSALSMN